MALKSLLFTILFMPSLLLANATVKAIHSSTEVLVNENGVAGFFVSKRVLFYSREQKKIIAIGRVSENEIEEGVVKVVVEEILDNYLLSEGDSVELLDFRQYRKKKIPGFFSLTLKGSHKTPAEFKDLAYFGVFTSEGHTLDKKEILVSPFQLQYGMTDNFSLRVVNALWLDGYANAGMKYNVLRSKMAKITVNALGAYKLQSQDWIGQIGGVVTMPQNSKFQNHFMLNITFDPQYEDAKNTKSLNLFRDSDIRSITEYITDRWNRILYGPVYNVELQTFGGTLTHMWIWNTFHISLGVATRDFSQLRFGSRGYYYVYDFFWRF